MSSKNYMSAQEKVARISPSPALKNNNSKKKKINMIFTVTITKTG